MRMVAHVPQPSVPIAPGPEPAGPPTPVPGDLLKRMIDLALGSLLLAAAVPVIGAAWVLVRLTSPGPGFYSQVRVGRSGRTYRLYKLRTMYHNCELTSGV